MASKRKYDLAVVMMETMGVLAGEHDWRLAGLEVSCLCGGARRRTRTCGWSRQTGVHGIWVTRTERVARELDHEDHQHRESGVTEGDRPPLTVPWRHSRGLVSVKTSGDRCSPEGLRRESTCPIRAAYYREMGGIVRVVELPEAEDKR